MAELQPQFWFPKIYSNTPNPHSLAVVKAVNQVVELFTSELKPSHLISICNKCKDQGILSSFSLEAKVVLKDIIEFLETKAEPPFYVLGTVTKNEAIVQSWNGLGLNLFDLPWSKEKKIFHYIPILSLPDMLKVVFHERYEDDDTCLKDTVDDINWAKCHEWFRSIQDDFGHGNRDSMQSWNKIKAKDQINKVIDNVPKILPCPECNVKKALEEANKKIDNEHEFQQVLRRVANLDCQTYRLASLSGVLFDDIIPQYKHVVILEDDEKMRNHIKDRIKEHCGDIVIQEASDEESRKKWRLCKKDGTEIKLKDKNYNEWETLVCFDLKLGKNEKTDGLPDGLRILYNTALHHPFVSRLVITGYRTQDERSLNAGTCGFLLKPFTNQELNTAIEKSSPFSALWICPKTVRENWEEWVWAHSQKVGHVAIMDSEEIAICFNRFQRPAL